MKEKGIHPTKNGTAFVVNIASGKPGKRLHLGTYYRLEDAIEARDLGRRTDKASTVEQQIARNDAARLPPSSCRQHPPERNNINAPEHNNCATCVAEHRGALPLEEVGSLLDLTTERIRQVEKEALAKLRDYFSTFLPEMREDLLEILQLDPDHYPKDA